MAEIQPTPRDILSEFWSPVCAVGSHGADGPNAQICVSVFGASVVPDRPRLLVNLWKDNYTHALVERSGSLAITVLSDAQAELVEPLGMRSGRDGDKLTGLDFRPDAEGNPLFADGAGTISGTVLDTLDLGDSTTFVVAVTARERNADAIPLTRARMHELLGGDFSRRWSEIAAARAPRYREQMRWE